MTVTVKGARLAEERDDEVAIVTVSMAGNDDDVGTSGALEDEPEADPNPVVLVVDGCKV